MNITTNYCNSKIEVDAWKTTIHLPFYYAQIYCGIISFFISENVEK